MPVLSPDETILGLLAIQARHGYELLDCFHNTRQLGRVWDLSTSQIYNVLKRLERESLVTGRQTASESGPPRVEYALTEAGYARLRAWLYEPAPSSSIRRVRVEFLSRLFIVQALNLPAHEIIQRQRDACQRNRDRLLHERAQAAPGMDALIVEFMLEQLDAVLRWIGRCEILMLPESNIV
jgi:DNA-binding PadR family transcriptional regulator